MRFTDKILHIPPYISTGWKNVSALSAQKTDAGYLLTVLLQSRYRVEIPNLDKATIEAIFEAHGAFLEGEGTLKKELEKPFSFSLPINSPLATLEPPSSLHNPEQADTPPLSPEALKKIAIVTNAFANANELFAFPKAVPDCNCPYCQVARFLHQNQEESSPTDEEEISKEELSFRNWNVCQTAKDLYLVTNPLDQNEHYNVYLGDPLGCTCGQKNCEHIRAVLST